jgi:hypothetical protein
MGAAANDSGAGADEAGPGVDESRAGAADAGADGAGATAGDAGADRVGAAADAADAGGVCPFEAVEAPPAPLRFKLSFSPSISRYSSSKLDSSSSRVISATSFAVRFTCGLQRST